MSKSSHFMLILSNKVLVEKETDFSESELGYMMDYEGIVVFVFRNTQRGNKWFVMTLQN